MRRLTALLVALVALAALAAGCGTKGPLYLPSERDTADLKQRR